MADIWASGAAYEPYVGRWSRLVAREFLTWLDIRPGAVWLDIGCGTGALSETILTTAAPEAVKGIDASPDFVEYARVYVNDHRVTFQAGNAQSLPFEDRTFDAVVSGLVLNFLPQPALALSEMARATRPGGMVAAYVWDYAGQMQLMRYFWDAAVALDADARDLDEGRRFPLCHPDRLADLFRGAGLADVQVRPIDVLTRFRDFDDYWSPFLGGQGPAPGYAMSRPEDRRVALQESIRAALPIGQDGSIPLTARAWAVRGSVWNNPMGPTIS